MVALTDGVGPLIMTLFASVSLNGIWSAVGHWSQGRLGTLADSMSMNVVCTVVHTHEWVNEEIVIGSQEIPSHHRPS